MKIILFCHSLESDWNHGNAHFLRGVVAELLARDHEVRVFEPAEGWSRVNLLASEGAAALEAVHERFPWLETESYDPADFAIGDMTDGADLVLVHEWSDPALVAAVGHHRPNGGYRALFHDTHHRAVTDPEAMARYDLRNYDGVLAFGAVIRDLYLERGWAARAWTWHEAADTRVFRPHRAGGEIGDLVWIGNWGDGERARELQDFLIEPVSRLGLKADVHGVRYPATARDALEDAGLSYRGWLPNHEVPGVFASHRATVHIPRRPYVEALPGIPTIRPFEAMACGIPLVSAPWEDAEHLFDAGSDYLVARDGKEMEHHLSDLLHDPALATSLSESGLSTINARHTCAHRVDELLAIVGELEDRGATTPGEQSDAHG